MEISRCKKRILFCFTYSGGSGDIFKPLSQYLKDSIEVVRLEYAGHEKRHAEPFYAGFDDLVEDLFPIIYDKVANCDCEYAFLGYSFGCIAAVEMLKRMEGYVRLPNLIILASHQPEAREELIALGDDLSNDKIKDITIKYGGIPERLRTNKSFWDFYLPIYRADYQIIKKYDFSSLRHSNIPAVVLYSDEDIPKLVISKWSNLFDKCMYYNFNGGHFFIGCHYEEVAKIIRKEWNSNNG
jgi:surfactin synthase thioesterase subunit